MSEICVKIPGFLKDRSAKLEKDILELVSSEEKRKLLSLFMDEVMKGSGQVSKSELVRLGREVKKGRFGRIKGEGLA